MGRTAPRSNRVNRRDSPRSDKVYPEIPGWPPWSFEGFKVLILATCVPSEQTFSSSGTWTHRSSTDDEWKNFGDVSILEKEP